MTTHRLPDLVSAPLLAVMLALSTLLLGLENPSQNPTSGEYQLVEPVVHGIADDNPLIALEDFDHFAKVAPECCNAPNRTLAKSEFEQRFGNRFDSQVEADAAYDSYNLAKNSDAEIVLGRQADTAVGGELGMTYLDNPNWTPNVNDAFIQGGIDANRPFYLGSNPELANFRAKARFDSNGNFIGRGNYPETVFLREMRQLRDAGYRLQGDYMVPPQ